MTAANSYTPAQMAALRASLNPSPKAPAPNLLTEPPVRVWSLPAAKAVVKARSGGRCELGGPDCHGVAHDVDHVFGRSGPNPHDPARLLHLCGFGNANGGCHQWVSQTRVGRAASIYVVELIAALPDKDKN